MLKAGTDLFFQEPDAEVRRLKRSIIVAVDGDEVTVELEAGALSVEVGDDALIFFEGEREFMQQFAWILELGATGPPQTVKLKTRADPISAESRQAHRVVLDTVDILAELGQERALEVQDISETGFAIVAEGHYPIGSAFVVSITHEGDIFSGHASIQSARELGQNRFRYGMRAMLDDPDGGDLAEGLLEITQSADSDPITPK